MKQQDEPNAGGINGIGLKPIDRGSQDFEALKNAIELHSMSRSQVEKRRDQLLVIRFKMLAYIRPGNPVEIKSAGEFLHNLIAVAGISKTHFAKYVDVHYSNMIAILNGRRKMNADLATKAEKIFGVEASVWMQVETKNELLRYAADNENTYDYSLDELVN